MQDRRRSRPGVGAMAWTVGGEERHRILERPNEGRVAAIKRGTKLGRNPKLNDHPQAEARKRVKAGEILRTIAKTFGVHQKPIGDIRQNSIDSRAR